MKKITYTLALIAAVAFSIGITACSDDRGEQYPSGGDRFTLSLSADNPQTRAVTPEDGIDNPLNENKIGVIDVFFFSGTTLEWHATANNTSTGGGLFTIPVPNNKRDLFDGNTTYNIYVVANNTADLSSIAEEADNLSALKDLVFQTAAFGTDGGSAAQASFVMDGMVTAAADLNSPDLGQIALKRAASKVRLALMEVDVEGYAYTAGTAHARLVHFTDKSALLDGGTAYNPAANEWLDTGYQNLSGNHAGGETTVAPFYAYANDWSGDAARETYIELRVPLTDNSTSQTENHLYRIPLTPQTPADPGDAEHLNKMERNFLYDIKVTIGMPGGTEEQPVEVSANYKIKDWSTKEILVDIKASHYLVLSEYAVVMPNITGYTINFNSSIPDVKLVPGSLKATYGYVNFSNGQPTTTTIPAGDGQYPTVTVQPGVAEGTITIQSAIPVNYIPKDITFQVTNGELTEEVTIRQLPPTYFTAEKGDRSKLRDNLDGTGLNNPYMYIITTLAPSGDIVWGFPPVVNKYTVNSAEVANMVSPRFMMASQLGATLTMNYNAAATNCHDYWEETTIGWQTVRYEDWRLPTEAEINYLNYLQHNNNPIGEVMTGRFYWDAYDVNGATNMNGGTGTATQYSAHVRCIRDIKD